MPLMPYIHFQGTCAEAMTFYADVFAAQPPVTMKYNDAPGGAFPPSDRIMHAEVEVAGGKLMASDYPPGQSGDGQAGFSVMCGAADLAEAKRIFDRLRDGGAEIMPFGPTFWSPGFGMVKDRFGTHWIIAAP